MLQGLPSGERAGVGLLRARSRSCRNQDLRGFREVRERLERVIGGPRMASCSCPRVGCYVLI